MDPRSSKAGERVIETRLLGPSDWSDWENLAADLEMPFLDPGYLAILR